MNKPKKHHFNPRLSLQYFAGAAPMGHVWTYEKLTGAVWSQTPENTAVETDFYSVEKHTGEMDTSIEEMLSKIESNAAPVYEELVNDTLPNNEQRRMDFAQFVAIAFSRTHAMRRMYAEVVSRGRQIQAYAHASNKDTFDDLIRDYSRDTGQAIGDELKERVRLSMLNPSENVIEVTRQSTVRAISVSDSLAPLFFKMNWTVIRPRHGYFITTDNPVTRDSDPKTYHPALGDGGFLNKTVEVKYPLSPQRLLLMTWRPNLENGGEVDREIVDLTNRGLAARADRFLYAHIKDTRISNLASKYKSSKQSMTTNGFGPGKFAETRIVRRIKDAD